MNCIQRFAGFVYKDARLRRHRGKPQRIDITLEPHAASGPKCSLCHQPAPRHGRLPLRQWLFVPLWGIKTYTGFHLREKRPAERRFGRSCATDFTPK